MTMNKIQKVLTICAACLLLALGACSRAPATPTVPAGLEKIEHFVFIMQENRSFDSYFGTYPGADGIPPGVCLPDPQGGPCVAPYHDTNDKNRGGPHDWPYAWGCINGGKMDGFVVESFKDKAKGG